MKANKKTIMLMCFCLGLILSVTTAFADISSKTGYDQFKDTIKLTAQNMSEKLDSFTMKSTISLKDNEKVLFTTNTSEKYDNKKVTTENTSSSEYTNGDKYNSYSYRDTKTSIWYDSTNDTYYESTYPGENKFDLFRNPFKEDSAKDVERIFDAVVGNLRDYVIVEDKEDGSKEFSGSLSEGQIPALVNAVSSFFLKQTAFSRSYENNKQVPIPMISDDIFIKNVKGKATANKDGIIENLLATGILCGKDKEGKVHELTVEILAKIVDINSTKVEKPDLTGKNVEKQAVPVPAQNSIDSKYEGKYKSDIIIEKDNKFVKIGERYVEISKIDGKQISGRYYEQYKPDYKQYESDKMEFTFDAEIRDYGNAEFNFTTPSGKEAMGSISFDMMSDEFYFSLPYSSSIDGYTVKNVPRFSRVFED